MFRFDFSFKAFLLLCCINEYYAEDLHCYSCAYVESGNLDLIDGFGDSSIDSCKWGRQPEESLLVNCTVDEVPGFRYFYACIEMRVFGKIITEQEDSGFNGTLRGCAVRRRAEDQSETMASKECQQGRLVDVTSNFMDLTGKEFLQNISKIFDGTVTRTHKFCACDFDACWEKDDDDGEGNSTTPESTENPQSTTDGGGDDGTSESSNEDTGGSNAFQIRAIPYSSVFMITTLFYIANALLSDQ